MFNPSYVHVVLLIGSLQLAEMRVNYLQMKIPILLSFTLLPSYYFSFIIIKVTSIPIPLPRILLNMSAIPGILAGMKS